MRRGDYYFNHNFLSISLLIESDHDLFPAIRMLNLFPYEITSNRYCAKLSPRSTELKDLVTSKLAVFS